MKKCTKCKGEKEESKKNFSWITHKNRYEAQCRECRDERRKELKELKLKLPKLPRKKKEKRSEEYYKNWRKEYNEINKEKIKKQRHEYYLNHRDEYKIATQKWRKENKIKFKESWKKSDEKFPLKRPARKILNYNIEKGYIIRPTICNKCGKEGKIDAHHEDYSKPLDVQWICKRCHGELHRQI